MTMFPGRDPEICRGTTKPGKTDLHRRQDWAAVISDLPIPARLGRGSLCLFA